MTLPSQPNRIVASAIASSPFEVGIVGLVGMKIEIQVAVAGQSKDAIERRSRIGIVDNDAAQNATVVSDEICESLTFLTAIRIEHRE